MKTTIYLLLTLLFVTATSCEVDVPDIDRDDPTFAFRVSGDGFDHTFQGVDDFDAIELHLRDGHEYSFIFSGGDAGGLKHLSWQWLNGFDASISQNVSPENITDGWVARSGGYMWYDGTIEDPRSGAIIAGKFTPEKGIPNDTDITFSFFARDFGGLDGNENAIDKYLKVVIDDHLTEIVPVN